LDFSVDHDLKKSDVLVKSMTLKWIGGPVLSLSQDMRRPRITGTYCILELTISQQVVI
jgi:hypothetical protein